MASTSYIIFPIGSSFAKRLSNDGRISRVITRCSSSKHRIQATKTTKDGEECTFVKRREAVMLLSVGISSFLLMGSTHGQAAGLPPEEKPRLCDSSCEKELENVPMVTTESGLKYKDIKVGSGPTPPVGYQVAANYVAMVQSGQIFDSSLEKGLPYIFRVGSDQGDLHIIAYNRTAEDLVVIKGLDEGILTMKVGGKRRLYIPGSLAFPKGLISAPGRPRVAPNSPVVFDVSLEYIPGLETDEEE